MSEKSRGPATGPIVSSAHLVSARAPEMSAYEFGLIGAAHAFQRWIARCMAAAGHPDLGPMDVLVLHSVNHRDRPKRLGDICLVLNVEDAHLVSYALKKLQRAGLAAGARVGKERHYRVTKAGAEACARYREVRESCLIGAFSALQPAGLDDIDRLAGLLRALSGLYDQAARSAASL